MFIDSFHQYYMCIQLIGTRFYLVTCCKLGKGQTNLDQMYLSVHIKYKISNNSFLKKSGRRMSIAFMPHSHHPCFESVMKVKVCV